MDAAVRCFDPGPPQKHLCFPQRSGALVEAVVRWGTQWCVGKRSTAFWVAAVRYGKPNCVVLLSPPFSTITHSPQSHHHHQNRTSMCHCTMSVHRAFICTDVRMIVGRASHTLLLLSPSSPPLPPTPQLRLSPPFPYLCPFNMIPPPTL